MNSLASVSTATGPFIYQDGRKPRGKDAWQLADSPDAQLAVKRCLHRLFGMDFSKVVISGIPGSSVKQMRIVIWENQDKPFREVEIEGNTFWGWVDVYPIDGVKIEEALARDPGAEMWRAFFQNPYGPMSTDEVDMKIDKQGDVTVKLRCYQ